MKTLTRWFWNFLSLVSAMPNDIAVMKIAVSWFWSFLSLISTILVLGLSLLPLSALLVALPLISPNEAVLRDTLPAAKSWQRGLMRRLFGAIAGFIVLIALLAFSVAVVSWLPLPPTGQLGPLAKKILGSSIVNYYADPLAEAVNGITPPSPKDLYEKKILIERRLSGGIGDLGRERKDLEELAKVDSQIAAYMPISTKMRMIMDPELRPWVAVPLWKLLPTVMVEHWPFILLVIYATDLLLLLLIGKVPIKYNVRNLIVRWRISGLTATAFTVVVGLLVGLLAFVNGMYKINQDSGIPGNVFVLSDGATDELFSNLGYGDLDNAFRITVELDQYGMRLDEPIRIARAIADKDGRLTTLAADVVPPEKAEYLASKEIYFVVNQERAKKPDEEKPRRRFLNMRAIDNPLVAAAVHNIRLENGSQWFNRAGVQKGKDDVSFIQCVLGEGAAGVLGEDANKPRLERGDTFQINDLACVVVGIMKAEGTTFGSEIWVQNIDLITRTFGKKGNFTTLVVRNNLNTLEASQALAYHLQNRYTQQKLKAFAEPEYYAELTKTNDQFLINIILVAIIMAIGGVFGVMNTQFASIAARIREVGVLRILGFKRWQILISFMLESLTIAFVGGLLGCAIGYLMNGYEAQSTLSSGAGGGGKSVALKMLVNYETVAAGVLFTLMMGRIGGLVPALSAMRMKILDSLR